MNSGDHKSYSPLRRDRDASGASSHSGRRVVSNVRSGGAKEYLAPRQIQGILTNSNNLRGGDSSQNRALGYPLYNQPNVPSGARNSST